MRFRNVVVLAAVASSISFLNGAISFYRYAIFRSQNYGDVVLDLLEGLLFALLFWVLYGEASERFRADARAVTALVLAVVMMLDAVGKVLNIGLSIFTLRHYGVGSGSDILEHAFYFVETSVWIAFLFSFSRKRVTATSGMIPRAAGVLALLTLCSATWNCLQLYKAYAAGYAATANMVSVWWIYAVLLLWSAAMLPFLVVIWRRWKHDLPIHENVIC